MIANYRSAIVYHMLHSITIYIYVYKCMQALPKHMHLRHMLVQECTAGCKSSAILAMSRKDVIAVTFSGHDGVQLECVAAICVVPELVLFGTERAPF